MNIWGDITEALENYYKSKKDVIEVLNDLQFNIHDNHNRVVSDLDETIKEYADKNNICPSCGYELQYDYKEHGLICEQCGYTKTE